MTKSGKIEYSNTVFNTIPVANTQLIGGLMVKDIENR